MQKGKRYENLLNNKQQCAVHVIAIKWIGEDRRGWPACMWYAKSKLIPVYNGDSYLCFLFSSPVAYCPYSGFLSRSQSVSECWAGLDPGSH